MRLFDFSNLKKIEWNCSTLICKIDSKPSGSWGFGHSPPNALHDRYNNAILHYMFFEQYCKGGKLKYCEVCGKLILVNGKERTKYCKPCGKKINIEKTYKNQRK